MKPIKVLSLFQNVQEYDCPVINTTSRANNWQRDLSPFYLGPCKLYGSFTARIMENGWQYSKVYAEHISTLPDIAGEPTSRYFDWAIKGWNSLRAVRYPMGKGVKPVYSWWNGQALDYIEARKQIYIPLYARAVRMTRGYAQLKNLYHHKQTKMLILQDFDAYDHAALGMTLDDVLNNQDKKMGHAFVLMMLLQCDAALKQTPLKYPWLK